MSIVATCFHTRMKAGPAWKHMYYIPMRTIKLIIPLLLLLLITTAKAQTPSITELQLQYQTASAPNGVDSMMKVVCIITISDTVNAANVAVRAGTTYGDNDKFDHTFSLTSNSSLPAGTSFSREGLVLTIVLGDFIYGDFYYETKLQDTSSNWSPVKRWNAFGQE